MQSIKPGIDGNPMLNRIQILQRVDGFREEKTSTPVEIMQHVLRKLSQDSFGHTDLEGLVGSRWWSQKNAGLSPRSEVCARGRDWVTIHMNWVLEAMRLDRLITRDGLKGKGSEGK